MERDIFGMSWNSSEVQGRQQVPSHSETRYAAGMFVCYVLLLRLFRRQLNEQQQQMVVKVFICLRIHNFCTKSSRTECHSGPVPKVMLLFIFSTCSCAVFELPVFL